MEYRVYVIGDDGHFIRAVHLVCSDDNAALTQAKQLVDRHHIELWQGDRKLATSHHINPKLKQTAADRFDSAWKRKKTPTSFKVRSRGTKGWPAGRRRPNPRANRRPGCRT